MTGPAGVDRSGAGDEAISSALRELSAELHETRAPDDARADIVAHLDAARELVAEGRPRLRWYEAPDGEDRDRTRDLSVWSGVLNPVAPPMTVTTAERTDGTPCARGVVRLDRLREGPPRSVHGGVIAGLFDEILGSAQRLTGKVGAMTGRLTVRYRRPAPVDEELVFEAWVDDERTRRVTARAECRSGRDLVATAEALFLRVDYAAVEAGLRSTGPGRSSGPSS